MPADLSAAWPANRGVLTPAARAGLSGPAFRWALLPALAAWAALIWLSGPDRALQICLLPAGSLADNFSSSIAAGFALAEPAAWAGEWALMVAAMMFPLLMPMIGHVAARSFVARRDRAAGLFVGGYALAWIAAGAAVSVALIVARASIGTVGLTAWAGPIGCGLVAIWQLSPAKARALNRCHRTVPLRPLGWAGDRDALAFGLAHGGRCIHACLPAMALPLIAGHSLGAMAAVGAILLAERARPNPQFGLSALVLALLGAASLVAQV